MCIQKPRPNRAILLYAYLILGMVAPVGAQDNDMEAFRRIGRKLAGIAQQAYPAVVVIEVRVPLASESAIRDMLHRRSSRGRLERGDVPEEQFGAGRSRPVVPDQFMEQLGLTRPPQFSRGLGIIVSADGWIITTRHVVGDANDMKVELADGRSFPGKVVGTDRETDIAVAKIEADNLKALARGDSDAVIPGDWVIGIGNPMGIGRSFTFGLVTGKHRSGLGLASYEDFIQTDTVPAFGDAGGPILDLHGRVVGMNVGVLGAERGRGVGLAIPINMVKGVYGPLAGGDLVRRGFLGIQMQDIDAKMAEALGLAEATGVVVVSVVEASPAANAGLQKGDVIIQFDGEAISSSRQLRHIVARRSPDADVNVAVVRDGQRQHFTVTLVQRPSAR